MDYNLIWQTILIFAVSTLLLRFGGRMSISQMTIPQTVILISFGTLIIKPVTGKGLWTTFVVGFVFILCLVISEYIQLKFNRAETAISGKAIPVIENGTLNELNLKKLRMPVDELESRLRQSGISAITDVEFATIEPSGLLGYSLKKEKQPATKEDIQNLIQLIQNGHINHQSTTPSKQDNIFIETLKNHSSDSPTHLQ
ncbi:DUF421 domain-containing protein [Cytobacillus depressus]|uniref:DUF421 domain-containing protein n=1 Tax=Cytobacillus depressus TaxID=1602942 RepID=A0A6L3V486_9BACI|nr:YetF domain-containing protein [Cytobacillus depressus]KAB2334871.1 DUF421 domain-containing protein [Cytobacillus depressus]